MLVIYEMWLRGGLVASSYLERLILCLKRLWFGLDLGGSPLGSLPPDATGLNSVVGVLHWTRGGFSIGFFATGCYRTGLVCGGFSIGFFFRVLHWVLLPLLHNRAWVVLRWGGFSMGFFCHDRSPLGSFATCLVRLWAGSPLGSFSSIVLHWVLWGCSPWGSFATISNLIFWL